MAEQLRQERRLGPRELAACVGLAAALALSGGVLAGAFRPQEFEDGLPPRRESPSKPITWGEVLKAGLEPREAMWWEALGSDVVRCTLCPRQCVLYPGQRGHCRVRSNYGGKLFTLVYGSPVSANARDPVEKKPLYHVLPGSRVTSISTAGCNLGCIFCQNWEISQTYPEDTLPDDIRQHHPSPREIVELARRTRSRAVAYTYTEPTIFYEYMLDTAKRAREAGLKNLWITCGYIEEEPLRELAKVLDAANVDLKGFTREFYRKYCDAEPEPVMRTIKLLKELGVHVEVTNLVIPGANDDEKSVRAMCRWLAKEVGSDTPLHFSRYRPAYRMRSPGPTPLATLVRLREIAREEGLQHVYIGNVAAPDGGTTRCAKCGAVLVERAQRYALRRQRVGEDGRCPECGAAVPGIWK